MAKDEKLHPAEQYAHDCQSGAIVASELVKLTTLRHINDRKRSESNDPSFPYYFDEDAGQYVIDFIEMFCCHSVGEWAGQPFLLEPWQKFIVWCLFGWKRRANDARRFKTAMIHIARKNGKALDVETPIPTPDGWKRMGDLKVGDIVFDADGKPTRVIGAYDVMHERPCYRVTFSDRTSIIADGEHLWETRPRRTGRPVGGIAPGVKLPERMIFTTEQIADTLVVDCASNSGRVEWNHRIDVALPLDLPEADLPIPPYVLGAWLGDGHSDGACLTCSRDDTQTLDEIRACGVDVKAYRNATKSKASVYGLGRGKRTETRSGKSLQSKLRALGVLKNKHIPQLYLRSSIEQRTALLEGLMDTDGYVSKAGQCEFTSMSPQLRDGMMELLRTLGYKPTLKVDRAMLNGKDCGEKYRIQFWAFSDRPCFRLHRKRERLRGPPGKSNRSMTRQIVAVEPVESRPVRCIEVDNPRKLYLAGQGMVPTHNTQLLAAIGLYLLIADGEPAAEVFSAATKKDQARILFDESRRMVMASPHLKQLVQSYRSNMSVPETHAKFEPLSSDENTLDGLRVHGALIDELHSHKTRHVYDVLETATASRRQPLVVCITTSGFPFPDSICLELLGYGERILKGIIEDDTFFTISFALDPEDQWDDESTWVKANPNLEISVKLDDLRSKATKARETPSAQNNFKTKHLNIWCNSRSRWIPVERWDSCREDFLVQDLIGKECYAGLDLSTTTDLSAFVLVFPWEHETYKVLPFFWVPEENAELRARRDRVPYPQWIREGLITATPGNVIDYSYIRHKIVELSTVYKVREIRSDPWNATQILQQLQEDDGLTVVEHRQGFASMSAPMKTLETLVMSQKLRHDGNAVLRWMFDNVSVKMDPAGNIKPDKEKSAERIDGVVSLIMGIAGASMKRDFTNPYETGGIFAV